MWKPVYTFTAVRNVLKYSKTVNPSNLLNAFDQKNPEKIFKKKRKYPDQIYINNIEAAKVVAQYILEDIPKNSTILEVNPGNGFLTSYFLNNDNISKLLLYETHTDFVPKFEELHSMYPDRIVVKAGDFINLWKLYFRDKFDNGTRLPDFLACVPKKKFEDDINMKIFAAVGSYNFFKHLINSLVFHSSIYSYGRCEMYLVVPPKIYINLTCNKEAGYKQYRAASVHFQIMFEYKFLCKIPKTYFLPELYETSSVKKAKAEKAINTDTEFLYFIKIVPRKNLYDLCSLEDMPALWYFIKQSLISRKAYVIPFMERWVTACGPRVIVNLKPAKPVNQLYEGENISDLPKFSTPCTTMSTEDYHSTINIYTEFGELSPSNMLNLFSQFRNWPEYKESSFLASLESSLLKMEQSTNEHNVDGIDLIEEDDSSIQPKVIKKIKKDVKIKK